MSWLVGAAIILVLALVFDLALLAYAMYALLTVLLVSRFVTRSWAESIVASRECNRLSAEIGETVAVVVNIENRGVLPIPWCLIEDLLPKRALIHDPPDLKVVGRRVQLSMFGRRGRRGLLYQLRCNRRGYYQIGPLVFETGDLLGLHRRYRVATKPHFLLVYPQIVPLEGYDVSSKRPLGEVRMSYRLFEDPTRIAGVRKYEAGDPFNRVHWRATARTGVLHSKVYEPTTIAGATLLMEYHLNSHDHRHEPYRSELAVTAAASIANSIYEMQQQVGLVTNGRDAADRIRQQGWDYDIRTRDAARRAGSMLEETDRLQPLVVETRRGADQLMRILETLARIELTDGLTLPELIGETTNRIPRDASVLAIVPCVSAEFAIALGNLRRSGYAVSVIVNVYEEHDFAVASGPLLAEGIDTYHLKNQESIVAVCRQIIWR